MVPRAGPSPVRPPGRACKSEAAGRLAERRLAEATSVPAASSSAMLALLALTPKAVPRLVTLPCWTCVQEPPVLPVMIES